MIRRPRRTTRTYTRVPYPPLSRPRAGGAPALGRLERLASLSASDIEIRRVAWLAPAYLSERTCHGPQREQVLARLDALDLSLQQAPPQGGTAVRAGAALTDACRAAVAGPGQFDLLGSVSPHRQSRTRGQ